MRRHRIRRRRRPSSKSFLVQPRQRSSNPKAWSPLTGDHAFARRRAPPLDRRVVITALGIAQILAWGTSFYFPAVFAEPIVKETGWSLGSVVGGTSIGLLTAGLISPQVGRIIDVRGGRPVLLASSLFYAAGLALVGLSQALPV